MRITTQGDYGLICVMRIARRYGQGPVSVRKIATADRLPYHYVEKLLSRLRRTGIVASVRGPAGGYTLTRLPREITLKHLVDALEQETFGVNCSDSSESARCDKQDHCCAEPVWMELQSQIDGLLGGITLEMLLDEATDIRQTIRNVSARTAMARAGLSETKNRM